ncbi:ribosomal protein S10 domain-containing protein [Crepidotus variabilis]|uniref:Small ribosomal subunit protein uS10m n=1 Tax=Crepidotus variabilis TaxID=179855 RepID=A0A9P6JJJ4_9AGAR|nr:ribosomal protein S10 domain-containing protein [Crepidotus variabilis]
MAKNSSKETKIPDVLAYTVEAVPGQLAPSVASTPGELFGSAFSYESLGLKMDPRTLPLPLPKNFNPLDTALTEEQYASSLVHGRSVVEPYRHPRTHSIPVASIHFRSHHVELLNLFTHFASHAASALGIPIGGVASLPTKRTLWTVPRSPFAHKKAQENFERKIHKRAIKAFDADGEVVQRWVAYLRTNALAGVGMKVTTWDRVPLGIGNAKILKQNQDSATNSRLTAPNKIKQLGEEIIKEEQRNA